MPIPVLILADYGTIGALARARDVDQAIMPPLGRIVTDRLDHARGQQMARHHTRRSRSGHLFDVRPALDPQISAFELSVWREEACQRGGIRTICQTTEPMRQPSAFKDHRCIGGKSHDLLLDRG